MPNRNEQTVKEHRIETATMSSSTLKIRNNISFRLLNTNFKYPSSKTKVKTAIHYSACTHINPTIVSLTKYTYTYQTEYTFIS